MNTTTMIENEILARLETIERILLHSTPGRKLPPDLQKRALELEDTRRGEVIRESGDRLETLRVEFERLAGLHPVKQQTLKFPKAIIPALSFDAEGEGHFTPSGIVPYSILVNRCEHRKAFRPRVGEIDARTVVEDTLAVSGFTVSTLHDLALVKGSSVRVVRAPAPEAPVRRVDVPVKSPEVFDREAFARFGSAPESLDDLVAEELGEESEESSVDLEGLGDDDDDLLEDERAEFEAQEQAREAELLEKVARKPLKISVSLGSKKS